MMTEEEKETEQWETAAHMWMERCIKARDRLAVVKQALIEISRYSRQPSNMGAGTWDYIEELRDIHQMIRDAIKECEK